MAAISHVQSDFRGGSWSPYAQGQIEHPRYKTALNISQNGFPLSRGPWSRRFGFQLCGPTRKGQLGRTLQFNFTDLGEYRVELTQYKARIYFGAGLVHDDVAQVTNISTDTPAIITISGATNPWSTGDAIEFALTNLGDSSSASSLIGRRFVVTRLTNTTYSLVDELLGAQVNGANLNWNTASVSIQAQHILEFNTPYQGTDWQQVRIIPAANVNPDGSSVAILLHNSYPTQVITATLPLLGTNRQTFTIAPATFFDGPYYDPPINSAFASGALLTVTAGSGNDIDISLSDATAAGPNGFQNSDVGRFMRLYCQPPAYDPTASYTAGQQVTYNNGYFICTQATSTGITYYPNKGAPYWAALAPAQAAFWVWGIIKSVSSSTACVLTAQTFIDGYLQLPFAPVSSGIWKTQPTISTWQMGLFSATTGYPACGCYHQGRLGLSGVKGNRIDLSYSNQLFVFSTTDEFGNVGAGNAIAETFDSDTTNTVYFMEPSSAGVICGTKTGEWLVSGPGTGVLAPNNIQAVRNTSIGCANILPVRAPLTTVIVHKYQKELYEYFPDLFSGKITAPVLNELAKHLSVSNIQELAYMSEPEPMIFARNGDGSWQGCTYRRSTLYGANPPDYNGFHSHTMGDNHSVQSLTVGPSPDGTRDALYLTTQDPKSGFNFVSVSRPLLQEEGNLLNYWGVDTGIVPYGCKETIINGQQGLIFYGLSGFDIGDPLTAMIAGLDCGDFVYDGSGTVFVPFNNDPGQQFNPAFIQSIQGQSFGDMKVSIDGSSPVLSFPAVFGFTFTIQGQRVRAAQPQDTGVPQGASIGTTRREHMYGALIPVGVTGTVFTGTDFNDLKPMIFAYPNNVPYNTSTLFSGVQWDTTEDDYSFDSMKCWQMTRPLPFVLAAMGGFAHGQGR